MIVEIFDVIDYQYWFDLAYEIGFDHGFSGKPPVKDRGDVGYFYMAGYKDGKASQ